MKKFRYKNILLFGTLQFCGNFIEYFSENTEKLVVYFVMPRKGKVPNMVRTYNNGVLTSQKIFYSPGNFFLCYIILYINFIRIIFTHFGKKEKFYFICGHPLFSFFKSFFNLFRKYELVYFVGDYYPGYSFLNIIYRNIFEYYHRQIKYRLYISDRLNQILNGKIINSENVKTIMWGIDPPREYPLKPEKNVILCFIGEIRPSHGLELALKALKKDPTIKIKIIGNCEESLFSEYKKIIAIYNIKKQIEFPNKFIEVKKLEEEVKGCHIGIALYSIDKIPYYSDPGKVKTYAQLGLPILMTNAAQIVEYISKFGAGEIVEENVDSVLNGILKIKNHYNNYIKGLKKFNKHFNYRQYYLKRFSFLEKPIL